MSRLFRLFWLLILFNFLVEGLSEKEEILENSFTKSISSSSSLRNDRLRIYARNVRTLFIIITQKNQFIAISLYVFQLMASILQ